MQKIIGFWNKDIVNKLIVVVILLIVGAILVEFVYIVTQKSAGARVMGDLFPTPTTPLEVILTRNAATAEVESAMATASVPPTMTTMHFIPQPAPETPSAPLVTSTPTPVQKLSPTPPTETAPTFSPIATQAGRAAGTPECLPASAVKQGTVVEIVDGVTIKVLIDGLVYTVRYIGLALPQDNNFASAAEANNGDLVFRKEITLIADNPDKDALGRLLRYVLVDDKMVNLEQIQLGLALVAPSTPALACASLLLDAEESAKAAQIGIWKITPATARPN